MEGRLLLDVVVAQGTTIFQLFASEDQSLLVWRDAFLVLDLGFDILDGVAGFNLQGDGFASQGLDEDLHTTTQTQHEMKGGLFLDVVVAQGTTIFQLFASEDQPLLVWRDTFLVLDLGLDVLNGVAGFNLQGDGFAGQGLDEDLHTTTQTQHQMEGRLLLDVVVTQGTTIFKLLACEDQPLLVWGDAFFVLDLGFDILDGVAGFNLESDGFASQGLDKDLHTTTQTQHQMEGRLLLDVVVTQGTAIFQLFASEDQPLLVWRDTFLVLDLGLHILNGVTGFYLQGDGFSCQCLDEDLHTTTQTQHKMKGGLFLDVVVAQGTTIFQLFSSKDQSLLVWWDTFFVLNLGLHILNGVTWFNFQGDGFSCQCLDEDLHTTTQTQHKMKGRFFLDVVVAQGTAIFQLFAGENQPLLVGWDAFFVLNFCLDVFNGVAWLDFEGDCLSRQSFDENLHSTSQTQYQMKGRFFLDVVVAQGTAIFQLFAGENQPLLVGWDAFFVLNFCLDVFNGVAWLDFEGDCLSRQSFDENLHSTSQTQYQMKGRFFLDVVVAQGTAIFQLFAGENQPLLIGRNAFFVLDLCLDIFNGVTRLDFKRDGLSRQSFHENLHSTSQAKHQMKSGLLLDVVVTQCTAIFELLASENETLLIGRDAFLVLNLRLHIFDAIARFNFKSDSLTS